jgi:hypothetical protein
MRNCGLCAGHCFHSYSQLWLWPYGYAYNAYPENYKEIEQLAIDASDALFQAGHMVKELCQS